MTMVVGKYMRELALVPETLVEDIIVDVYEIIAKKETSLIAKILIILSYVHGLMKVIYK